MEFDGAVSDFTIIVYKDGYRKSNLQMIDGEMVFFFPDEKNKISINPMYRISSKSKQGVLLRRLRQEENWELECIMMMKVMPLEIFLPTNVLDDIHAKRFTAETRALLHRGVLLAVPETFI